MKTGHEAPRAGDEARAGREDIGSNPAPARTIGEVMAERLSRRAVLLGLAAAAAAPAAGAGAQGAGAQGTGAGGGTAAAGGAAPGAAPAGPSTLTFGELTHGISPRDRVPEGYEIQVLLRWGDPILPDAPAFDPASPTAEAQARQFGYNNDYVDFFPLPRGSRSADHGLLVVNHEYTNTNLMFPGIGTGQAARLGTTAAQASVEIAAHGASVVEIRRVDGTWRHDRESRLNRRITGETPIRIGGPAAGHERLRTSADPTGTLVRGMLNNCAGGNTPWGTVVTCEENFNQYFGGDAAETGVQAAMYRRYGIERAATYAWDRHFDRFNLDREPNEPNRFGWVVEFDPYDPESVPVKRTALGRVKHEGCTHAVCPDGRVAFYMGDDERFDYVYKFVTARPWNREDRAANRDLLDEGTLYVARFEADGTLRWLPVVHGQGPLTEANGFRSQAEVLIETRRAADLLGATPMDRPEDVETNPATGRVYVMLTNNGRRTPERVDAANPRPRNDHGHVVEIVPPGAGTGRVDHAAETARWEIFLVAGQPGAVPGTQYNAAISGNGWLSCPDNCTFDSKGRIWIATDGAPASSRVADGLYGADTTGEGRALTRLFYQAPTGAEVCGPKLTPDDSTLFLAIQHPGEDAGSTFERPSTRWPDFREGMPPRPSVIAIVRKDGGTIGS
ncbi:PhoX family phosphatase [Roseomonas sp. NAR14]|uniref:PhoX family phosphatase n=1 Tax=Roseomonas acroporae TaxID=2937791 RepID=A0A9X1Y870_9PROT|nr:PhoX family phosphatase [Roseomonas acroporae]MCK8785271.1 PhoX family phosphatase [Roseomonas acroporae]